jgi:hypothetical protein
MWKARHSAQIIGHHTWRACHLAQFIEHHVWKACHSIQEFMAQYIYRARHLAQFMDHSLWGARNFVQLQNVAYESVRSSTYGQHIFDIKIQGRPRMDSASSDNNSWNTDYINRREILYEQNIIWHRALYHTVSIASWGTSWDKTC